MNSSLIELVFLIESKMKNIPRGFMCQVCPFELVVGVFLPSKGVAGGIWALRDSSKLEILQSWFESFSVSVKGQIRGVEDEWVVTRVYGPCALDKKQAFFAELLGIRENWDGPWCVCGVFNEILSVEERLGASSLPEGAGLFLNFVNDCSLQDVPIVGTIFS